MASSRGGTIARHGNKSVTIWVGSSVEQGLQKPFEGVVEQQGKRESPMWFDTKEEALRWLYDEDA